MHFFGQQVSFNNMQKVYKIGDKIDYALPTRQGTGTIVGFEVTDSPYDKYGRSADSVTQEQVLTNCVQFIVEGSYAWASQVTRYYNVVK